MQGLRIINIEGLAPSAEEIDLAHRVANRYRDHQVGTVNFTDTSTGIYVRYHPFKLIAFTQSSNKVYFGYDQKVEFKCPCRAIQIIDILSSANPRVAAFLTDGTELASIPTRELDGGREPSTQFIEWNGGGSAQLFDYVPEGGIAFASVVASDVLIFDVPEDACYIRSFPPEYPDSEGQYPVQAVPSIQTSVLGDTTTYTLRVRYGGIFYEVASGTRTISGSGETLLDTQVNRPNGHIRNWNDDQGTFEYAVINGTNPHIQPNDMTYTYLVASIPEPYMHTLNAWREDNASNLTTINQWRQNWFEAQEEALDRARAWRKKCSDGRISMLRNGILPIELDIAVKRSHPISANLKREIPMQVFQRQYTLESSVEDSSPSGWSVFTYTYSGAVTLRYEVDGQEKIEQFLGTAVLEDWVIDMMPIPLGFLSYSRITYSNMPLLVSDIGYADTGMLGGLVSPSLVGDVRYDNIVYIDAETASYGNSIMVIANGVEVVNNGHYGWVPDSTYGNPTISYKAYEWATSIPPQSKDTIYTIPQFLFDYIEASKPIEFETINDVKQPVTPSRNWLSSRLTDKEIVTIIPLSFVTEEGEERGMFPYTITPTDSEYELFTQIKLYGFARFQFDYATSTFTFKDWTEFTTEGKVKVSDSIEHSFNDEINPTALTIGDKTYTLEPIVIDCEEDWLGTNCVFIGDKTPWTDVKEDAKEQTSHIGNSPSEGYELTAEERLYKAIREAIK